MSQQQPPPITGLLGRGTLPPPGLVHVNISGTRLVLSPQLSIHVTTASAPGAALLSSPALSVPPLSLAPSQSKATAATSPAAAAVKCFEGKNIHAGPDGRRLCSSGKRLCTNQRLEGFGFCIRHITEDPSAPYTMCEAPRPCGNAVHISEPRPRLCPAHKDATAAAPPPTQVATAAGGIISPRIVSSGKKKPTIVVTTSAAEKAKPPPTILERHGIMHSAAYKAWKRESGGPVARKHQSEKRKHHEHGTAAAAAAASAPKLTVTTKTDDDGDSSSCPPTPKHADDDGSEYEEDDDAVEGLVEDPEETFFSGEFLEEQKAGDGEDEDGLRESSVLTEEEVVRRRRDKINRLLRLYKLQTFRLRDDLRIRYRKYFVRKQHSKVPQTTTTKAAAPPTQQVAPPAAPSPVVSSSEKCSVAGCQGKSLLPTTFCFNHILMDPKQKLFKGCTFVSQSGSVCGHPIIAAQTLTYCSEHTPIPATPQATATVVQPAPMKKVTLVTPPAMSVTVPTLIPPTAPPAAAPIPAKRRKLEDDQPVPEYPPFSAFSKITDLVTEIQEKRHQLLREGASSAPSAQTTAAAAAIPQQPPPPANRLRPPGAKGPKLQVFVPVQAGRGKSPPLPLFAKRFNAPGIPIAQTTPLPSVPVSLKQPVQAQVQPFRPAAAAAAPSPKIGPHPV